MQRPFGEFRVRVDPWEVDYGDQTPLSPISDGTAEDVDYEVEIPGGDWRPLVPCADGPAFERLVFVDGVRRLEVRLLALHDQQLVHGGFGSFAVGAVRIGRSASHVEESRVARLAVLGAGYQLPGPVAVRGDLVYSPASTPAAEADAALRHIQKSMRLAEAKMARDSSSEDTLTIVDGPLSFEPERRGVALGYIKRIHELYLPGRFLSVLASLPAGTRTPLFAIHASKAGFARYSWFQRLAAPSPGATEMHGIVRLEAATSLGVDAARNLADAAALWLPAMAPTRSRDPRSPQNLLPIGALEQQLRAQLGDARLFRRWIEAFVAKEASLG